jgi:hypothetical protein
VVTALNLEFRSASKMTPKPLISMVGAVGLEPTTR